MRQFEISSRACSRFNPIVAGPLLRFWQDTSSVRDQLKSVQQIHATNGAFAAIFGRWMRRYLGVMQTLAVTFLEWYIKVPIANCKVEPWKWSFHLPEKDGNPVCNRYSSHGIAILAIMPSQDGLGRYFLKKTPVWVFDTAGCGFEYFPSLLRNLGKMGPRFDSHFSMG